VSRVRLSAIFGRVVAQFRRDHRTLALLFVVPVVISGLLGWIVRDTDDRPPAVGAVVLDSALVAPVERALRTIDGDRIEFLFMADTEAAGREQLAAGQADVLLVVPEGTADAVRSGRSPALRVVTRGLDPAADGAAVAAMAVVARSAFGPATGATAPTIDHETLYGSPDADQLDGLGPVFLGFFAYFFVFILTGVSFLRERTSGTLERLLATPVTRGEIILGYALGFGLFAAVQVIVLLAFALADLRTPAFGPVPELVIGLGVANAGSPVLVFGLVLLLALGAVSLGILLSTFARTELQVLQFIPLVIVPQGLLAGLLWPVERLPAELEALSRIMPMRYGIDGLKAVMVRGAGLDDGALQADVAVLAGLAIVFVLLASRTVRRETS
jgi:ABC-2 type transport system permease protein